MNISYGKYDNSNQTASLAVLIFFILYFLFSVMEPIIVFNSYKERFRYPLERFYIFLWDLKYEEEKGEVKYKVFHLVNYGKRILYAIFLVYVNDSMIQCMLLMGVNSLFLIYMLVLRPYENLIQFILRIAE